MSTLVCMCSIHLTNYREFIESVIGYFEHEPNEHGYFIQRKDLVNKKLFLYDVDFLTCLPFSKHDSSAVVFAQLHRLTTVQLQ